MMLRNRNRHVAITLVEVLIVLTLMSISLLFALPAMNRWLNLSERVRIETRIRDAVQLAKIQAVLAGHSCQVRPDRSNSSLKIEMLRGAEIETLKVVSIPKRSMIMLKSVETGESISSITIDSHGLFIQDIRIELNSDGQLYSWMTDRQTGMILAMAK